MKIKFFYLNETIYKDMKFHTEIFNLFNIQFQKFSFFEMIFGIIRELDFVQFAGKKPMQRSNLLIRSIAAGKHGLLLCNT